MSMPSGYLDYMRVERFMRSISRNLSLMTIPNFILAGYIFFRLDGTTGFATQLTATMLLPAGLAIALSYALSVTFDKSYRSWITGPLLWLLREGRKSLGVSGDLALKVSELSGEEVVPEEEFRRQLKILSKEGTILYNETTDSISAGPMFGRRLLLVERLGSSPDPSAEIKKIRSSVEFAMLASAFVFLLIPIFLLGQSA